MRISFFAIIVSLSFLQPVISSGQSVPYPKVDKLYKKGLYDQCLETITGYLSKANNEKAAWLYWMQSRCHLQNLQIQPSKTAHLKKAFVSLDRLIKKNGGKPAHYAHSTMDELTAALQKLSKNLTAQNSAVFQECLTIYRKHWFNEKATLFIYEMTAEKDPDGALKYLEDRITENYRSRKNGDTTSLYIVFTKVMLIHAEKGLVRSAQSIFTRGTEVYPENQTQFCNDAMKAFRSSLENHRNPGSFNRGMIESFAAVIESSPCKSNQAKEELLLNDYRWYSNDNPSFQSAVKAAKDLKQFNAEYGGSWFLEHFKEQLNGHFKKSDSIRLAVYFDMEKVLTTQSKLAVIEKTCTELIAANRPHEALALFRYTEKTWPAQKEVLNRLRLLFNNKWLGEIANASSSLKLKAILDYYDLNKNISGAKELTIKQLVLLNSERISANDFSQCMRITKAGLTLFPQDPSLLKAKRAWMEADYQTNYAALSGNMDMVIKNANPDKCQEGYVTEESQKKFMQVLNLVRRFAGIFDSCTLDAEASKKCQKAAMMMSTSGALTHSPGKDMKCYTEEGKQAAGFSNLSLGHNGISALFGQLGDAGNNNTEAGHRRWILNPKATQFAHGSFGSSMALGVFSLKHRNFTPAPVFDKSNDFVAWPTADFFPKQWDIFRWSFGHQEGQFSEAIVTVKQNGKTLGIQQHKSSGGYGISTVVWDFIDNYNTNFPVYVTVDKVKIWDPVTEKYTYRKFSYTVNFF